VILPRRGHSASEREAINGTGKDNLKEGQLISGDQARSYFWTLLAGAGGGVRGKQREKSREKTETLIGEEEEEPSSLITGKKHALIKTRDRF